MTGRGRPLATFIVTSVALFMSSLDNLVVTMALPAIKSHLHASLSSLEWTVNAYTLTFAVLLLPGATLGDRFGRKKVFMIGLSIFTTARRSPHCRTRPVNWSPPARCRVSAARSSRPSL